VSTMTRSALVKAVAAATGTGWLAACGGGQGATNGGDGTAKPAALRGDVEYAHTVTGSGLEWEQKIQAKFIDN
jgi:hypothetical protein